jgi:hypothetical protein
VKQFATCIHLHTINVIEEAAIIILLDCRICSVPVPKPHFYAMMTSHFYMALYMVKAIPRKELLEDLQKDLSSGKISKMRPFGQTLQYSLENARVDNANPDYALWIEEDYCSPPLAMERESVLDQYFSNITVQRVESEEEAWNTINDKPRLLNKN